jgi:hypothetical protein
MTLMNTRPDLEHCIKGTQLEYFLLSSFGYNSALMRYPKISATIHYCSPACPGCESPELWMWRTVYDSETLESDGVCPRCLNVLLEQAAHWHIPIQRHKGWKLSK